MMGDMTKQLHRRLDKLAKGRPKGANVFDVLIGLASAGDLGDRERAALAELVPEGLDSLYRRSDEVDPVEQRIQLVRALACGLRELPPDAGVTAKRP
jgi:hypothetical protein